MGLKHYVARRLIEIVPVVLIVVTVNFVLVHLAPGDIATYLAGREADPEFIESVRQAYGLNKPLLEQYVLYLGRLFRGDMGYSWKFQTSVLSLILDRLPNTVLLLGTCSIITISLGTLLGAMAARRYPGKIDKAISYTSLLLYSMPIYWFGLMMIFLFAVNLKWFPFLGFQTIGVTMTPIQRVLDILWHLVLPSLSLSLIWFGLYVRIARTSVMEVMREDYITAARGIGHSENVIFRHHALRNALLPVVTMAGLQLAFVVSGSVLTETVFSWPGMGRLVYDAVLARDYPLISGCYTLMSLFVAVSILLTDLAYAFLDPRVRYK
jgi:peptide/nickel transport system permease protein